MRARNKVSKEPIEEGKDWASKHLGKKDGRMDRQADKAFNHLIISAAYHKGGIQVLAVFTDCISSISGAADMEHVDLRVRSSEVQG